MGLGTQNVTLSNLGLMWKILHCSRFVREVHKWTVWQDLLLTVIQGHKARSPARSHPSESNRGTAGSQTYICDLLAIYMPNLKHPAAGLVQSFLIHHTSFPKVWQNQMNFEGKDVVDLKAKLEAFILFAV